MFWDYFKIGWEHIISIGAWDHLLFILSLSAVFVFKDWKQVLILVTAFTIGHTITLILATLNIIHFKSAWIEFLIPVTIVITAVINTLMKKFTPQTVKVSYFLALFFGFIHGMGFANGLRSLLGKSSDILIPLLGFNLGLEAGQIVVVFALLLLAAIGQGIFKVNRKDWVLFLSGGAFMAALIMALERKPF
ncbi:MAG TPA: HupE/UreJ family protein [Phnomibacter sp.]|nr:HupE/UreJ family protein [Phnomibacter sp.]